MKKKYLFPLAMVFGLSLSSCASVVNIKQQVESQSIWQQRQLQLSNIKDWHMKGRMVIVNGAELWAMTVDWKQKGEQYIIFLSGPFGAGKVQLAGTTNGVLLKNSDDQIFYAETPEELLLEHTGVIMPLSYLRFWMLGLPHPKAVNNKAMLDESGRLESLSLASSSQHPWDISFKRYTSIDGVNAVQSKALLELPDKIFIQQGDDIKVRVVVGEWLFDNS